MHQGQVQFQSECYSSSSYSQKGYKQRSNNAKTNKSSKCSSRKGSTDYDSKLKFKTQACKYWRNNVECPFAKSCKFAHGDTQIRSRSKVPTKYKTRVCQKFTQEGFCPYGTRCQFIHQTIQLPRVSFQVAADCLSSSTERFFSFLEQKENNMGCCGRLNFFKRLTGMEQPQRDYIIERIIQEDMENYVDVRSRHNSF